MSNQDSKDGKGVSRRELLTFWRKPLQEIVRPEPPPPLEPPLAGAPPLRPPGTLHETMLVNHCIRCGKCVEICPALAIYSLGPEWGRAAGTPAIDARKQPCVLCTDLQCTHVCPSGALLPTFANRDVAMGTARVDATRCVTHHGQACDVCMLRCPMPGALILDGERRLQVIEGICVGCGICEHVCPTQPASIHVVPRD